MTLARLSTALSAARDEARAAIGQAAQRTGVNFSYLLAQAQSESGLDAGAKASSSTATGLYQFLDQSWLAIVEKHGAEHGLGWAADAIAPRKGGGFTVDPALARQVMALREQAGPAALMAASYASDNAAGLTQALGRETNGTDLYMAHFLGLQGATRFLRAAAASPDASAASLFPREAHANRAIFYGSDGGARSFGQVYALMGGKLASAGAATGGDAGDLATPGALVQSLPGAGPPGDVKLAYADMDNASLTPTDDATTASSEVGTMLAALEQNRVNLLKPSPAQAKLAYLMLSATPISSD